MHHIVVNVSPNKFGPDPEDRRGRMVFLDRKDRVDGVWISEGDAVAEAKRLAMLNPQQQYAVMAVVAIFETTKPTVLKKIYNDQKELVLDKDGAK